jgi:phosphoglycolate phosphatase
MNARAYELIVFDWDGTLMDSAAQIVHCFERAFADANVPSPGDQAIRHIIGLGLTEAVVALLPHADAATRTVVSDRYRGYFMALDTSALPLFTGVREGLQALLARGHLLAVATGKSRRGLDRVLANTGLAELFVATRCADEAYSKPHPQMLEDILDRTGMGASQAIMVGDTTYDLIMARTAGVAGLAVSYGVHSRHQLLAETPLACCDSFDEVHTWLQTSPSAKAARS